MTTLNENKPHTICLLQVFLNYLKKLSYFYVTGRIRIQSPSIMVRYFFADCQFFDPTRITRGNIASLKYYSEGILSYMDMQILL